MADYIPQNNTNTPIDNQHIASKIRPSKEIFDLLDKFDPFSLAEMDTVKLMNRVDTKYVISQDQLISLLNKAIQDYWIVEIRGRRALPYTSVYYDTDDYQMYVNHHNKKLHRYKIRSRKYLNTGDSFLEIKEKNNKGRTSKKRVEIATEEFNHIKLNQESIKLIEKQTPFDFQELSPSLHNYFYRITLVDKKKTERVTFDMNLTYRNLNTSELQPIQDVVIVELKQDGNVQSKFREWLGEISMVPMGMSKYCLGIILTIPNIKYNRFKQKVLYINRVTNKNQLTHFN